MISSCDQMAGHCEQLKGAKQSDPKHWIASSFHSDSAEPFGRELFDPESFDPELTTDGLTTDGLRVERLVAGSQ
jgi:hypothetical protein